MVLNRGTNFALRAHVSKTTQRRRREETSSNTRGCSNTTEQSDSDMPEIPCFYNYKSKLQLCKGIQEGHMFK